MPNDDLAPADIFIQWKGTNVCMDFHCYKCDCFSHYDGDFCYYIQCPGCNATYAMPSVVPLLEVLETVNGNIKIADIMEMSSASESGWKPHKAREVVSFVGER